jgi:hypothetical protein
MTKDKLFKMIKISNVKRFDHVLDCGQAVVRYSAIIEGLRVIMESDGSEFRPHISVDEWIAMAKRKYISDLIRDKI